MDFLNIHYKLIKLKNKISAEEFDPNNLNSVADGVVAEGYVSRRDSIFGILVKEKSKMTIGDYYVIYDLDFNKFKPGIWKNGEGIDVSLLSPDEYAKETLISSGTKRKR